MTTNPTDRLKIITVPVRPAMGIMSLLGGAGGSYIEPPTVQRFSDEALQGAIDRVLAGLPADKRAAEVEIGFDARGVQVVGVLRLDHGWSLLGGVSWDKDGTWGGKVNARRVWK